MHKCLVGVFANVVGALPRPEPRVIKTDKAKRFCPEMNRSKKEGVPRQHFCHRPIQYPSKIIVLRNSSVSTIVFVGSVVRDERFKAMR